MIDELGLTGLQWELYRALLWNPRTEPRELAAALDVDTASLEADLRRLELVGLAVGSTSSPSRFRPVYPQVGLQRLLHQKLDQHDEEGHLLRELSAAIAEFGDEFAAHRREYEVSLLNEVTDPGEMASRVNELVRDSTSEILSFVTNTFSEASLTHARVGDQEVLDRGVRARSIYLDAAVEEGPTRDYLHWLESQGAFVRSAPSLPVRMIIFDGAAAVVSRRALDPGHGALVVQSQGLVAALVSLFEAYWGHARPLSGAGPGPGVRLSAVEHDILTLLAQGMKDDAIAHRLELSVRTVRRALNQLYERTGSGSRFELGVKATRFGWL
ncbi:MAG TPA: helix-turn-helix domain-containing protein [Demequina sp.]|nr:helix-turn-helix domain-containing protein [Demequina sp.]